MQPLSLLISGKNSPGEAIASPSGLVFMNLNYTPFFCAASWFISSTALTINCLMAPFDGTHA